MYAHFGSSLSLRSSHSHLHVSCALWALLLISSTSLFTSSPSLFSLLSSYCSCCLTTSTSLMSWINTLRTSAEDFGTLAENKFSTSCASRLRRDCVVSFHDGAPGWLLHQSWSVRYGLVRDVDTRKICKASSPTLVGECCLVCSFWSRRSPQVWIWEVSQLDGWVFSGASVLSCTVHSGMVAIVVCSCRGLCGRRLRWPILCVCGSTLWVLATSLCVWLAVKSECCFLPPRERCFFLLLGSFLLCCVILACSGVSDLSVVPKKTEIARSVRGPKLQEHRAEDALAEPYLEQKFWWLDNSRSQSSQWKLVNLETITDMQSLCRTRPPNGSSRIRAKQKTSQEKQRNLQKFLEPDGKPEVIYTDNSLEFGKACEDLSWDHCTSTPHRSETNGIAERALRRVKESTSVVLLQSGLDGKWWADSMDCYAYLRNIQDLLSDGKTPHERRFRKPLKGPIIPFGIGWVLP